MAGETQIYTVEFNGRVFDVEGPAGATPEQVYSFVQANGATAEQAPSPAPAQQPVPAPAQEGAEVVVTAARPQAAAAAPAQQPEGEVRFNDQMSDQPAAKLAPSAEAEYSQLLQRGTLQQITGYLQAQGRTTDVEAMRQWVARRDSGKPVGMAVEYALPQVETDAAGALGRGALDTLTFGALPKIGAGIAAAGAALRGEDAGDAYSRMLDANNAVEQADIEQHGVARVAGQLAGGFALPSGIEGVGRAAGLAAVRAGRTAQQARAVAARAITQRLAAVGAGYGAAHGALSADNLPDAVAGAIEEAAIGGVGGAAMGAVGRVAGARGYAARQATVQGPRAEIARAAQRQGVDVIRADVAGGPTKFLSEALASSPFGAQPLIKASERTISQLEEARDRVAEQVGRAFEPQGLGDTVIQGARRWRKDTKRNIGVLYDEAERLADGIEVNPNRSLDEVNAQILELEGTPGGSDVLPYMRRLAEDLESGPTSVANMRRMRTTMRNQFLKDGLDRSDAERRVMLVMDEAAQDIRLDLQYQGSPEAAQAFDAADRAYREYRSIADDVLAPLIGNRQEPKAGYAVAKALTSDLAANEQRAVRLIRTLPPEERANVQASIIGALGSGGKQGQRGFSIDLFAKHWGDVSKGAKDAFFTPESRAALDDLATISRGVQSTKRYANRSNTGGVVGVGQAISLGAGTLTGAVSIPTALATAGGQYGLARWLASPRFARALTRLPREAGRREEVFIGRLARIARAEPAIAADMGLISRVLRGEQPANAPAVDRAQAPANSAEYVTDQEALDEAQAAYEAEQAAADAPEVEPTVYPEDVDGYSAGLPAAG